MATAALVAEPARVEVFGIRHHGPGSARSLLAALDDYQPDAVLIEGPADADPLIGWAAAEGMEPPVALLGYAQDRPSVAAFWPYAVFSPEWQAMRWALRRDVAVSFCDLPAAMTLAERRRSSPATADHPDESEPGPDGEPTDEQPPLDHDDAGRQHRQATEDPLALLAAAAGYDDAERWWDDVIESRMDGASPFPALIEAMAEVRREVGTVPGLAAEQEARREAYMRQTIRAALKAGRRRVAVVCGAWHAPVLTLPLPPANADARILRGAPKRKVTLTWVPWTHERLASASGYGAGVTSPGWYHHLWTAPDQPIVRWLTAVARSLRGKDLMVSSAHVIEAVRLADTLAALRGRPLAGLSEVTEATRAVLCDGDEVAVRFVTDHLVVGQALGTVSDGVPTVPLDADLTAQCRRLRIRREPTTRQHDLDLRTSHDQAKSKLFHRLGLLGLRWIQPAESGIQSQGTFRETWEATWRPEYAVTLVEASVWGTTVEAAAAAKIDRVAAEGSLAELTAAVGDCLLADLPDALGRLLAALAEKAALDIDVVHLMDAVPDLARAQRYGDVRRTDTASLRQVSEALLLRICTGLPQALAGLDDDAAAAMRRRLDAVHAAIGLLAADAAGGLLAASAAAEDGAPSTSTPGPTGRQRWLAVLASVADRPDLNGQLAGRIIRILVDAELLSDAPVRLHRALSHGVGAATKAAWIDGFFSDGAVLLIHDPELLSLLDEWVSGLGQEEFVDVLPLVRRTFGAFAESERRAIAGRVAAGAGQRPEQRADDDLDLELAAPALATVRLILGAA
ncbi:MAG: hypothetical protein QOF52_1873 [Propionibacteriaceae bacterium]|nr:hypothetical protein [Propionibacteriaceae bacterium]MDX6322015.1 hypothetical protein [Propionibacteriaceae bacterium]